jgi:hypothetical protein
VGAEPSLAVFIAVLRNVALASLAALYTEDGVALQLATELIYLGHTATTADAEGLKGAGDEVHFHASVIISP